MARRTRSPRDSRESRSIETTGRTIDDAVAKASAQLKVSEHDLDIKVLEEGSKGFLGIGSKEAKIRATVKGAGAAPDRGPRPPRDDSRRDGPRRDDVRRDEPRRPRRSDSGPVAPEGRDDRPKSDDASDGDSRRPRNRRGRRGRDREEGGTTSTTRQGRESREGRESRDGRERRPGGDRSGGGRGRRDSAGANTGVPALPDADFEARAKALLSGILERMGFPPEVESRFDDGAYLLTISGGDDEAVLIGRKGETLDALQHIVYKTVSRGREDSLSVRIDVAGYREKRDEVLAEEATAMAQVVLQEGRSQQTEPLRPAERRIVHRAITEVAGVTSRAIGNGVVKRILIEVEGSTSDDVTDSPARSDSGTRRSDARPAARRTPSAPVVGEVIDYVSNQPAPSTPGQQNEQSEKGASEWGRKSRPSKKLRRR